MVWNEKQLERSSCFLCDRKATEKNLDLNPAPRLKIYDIEELLKKNHLTVEQIVGGLKL